MLHHSLKHKYAVIKTAIKKIILLIKIQKITTINKMIDVIILFINSLLIKFSHNFFLSYEIYL